jgi:hypothetical protein
MQIRSGTRKSTILLQNRLSRLSFACLNAQGAVFCGEDYVMAYGN